MSDCTSSFVIATHNRWEILTHTLEQVRQSVPDGLEYEVLIVDNASTSDPGCGTGFQPVKCATGFQPVACGPYHRHTMILRLNRNRGSCAKAWALDRARGKYVVFLDDDSFPRPGSLERMIDHFEADPRLAAIGFRVFLPDGGEECGAFGDVFVGCGVGLRRQSLMEVGGLDRTLFMQAEEYDLAFRLVGAGWRIGRFDDVAVEHLKASQGRSSERTTFYDTRNNLLLTYRYLPDGLAESIRHDWRQRYAWLAENNGTTSSFRRGAAVARRAGTAQRARYAHHRLSPEAVDTLFHFSYVRERFEELSDEGVRRVVLVGFGKNILPFVRGARAAGISILAIADDRFAGVGRYHRSWPVVPIDRGLNLEADAYVISDTSPVHAKTAHENLSGRTGRRIARWFGDDLEGRHGPSMESEGCLSDGDTPRPGYARPCHPSLELELGAIRG